MSLSPTEDRGKPCDATSAPCWREAKTIHRPEAPAEDRVLGLASRQEVRVGRRAGQQCGLPLNRSSRSIRLMQRISFFVSEYGRPPWHSVTLGSSKRPHRHNGKSTEGDAAACTCRSTNASGGFAKVYHTRRFSINWAGRWIYWVRMIPSFRA